MAESPFKLTTQFEPKGDQPQAIAQLMRGLEQGEKHQVLLGITGSGKTFTVGNVIARYGKPTLIMAPNKTLAAQLYGEMKELFPENAVEHFVSYYDYYQPEASVPSRDPYIGSAESYAGLLIDLKVGEEYRRDNLLRMLVDIQYERNDIDFHRGTFRVRGDIVEVFPAYEENLAVRIEFFGDQ